MEPYRSYPDDRGYQDGGYQDNRGYPEPGPPEPGYGEGTPWYDDPRGRDLSPPEPPAYDSGHRDLGSPPLEPPRPVPTQAEPLHRPEPHRPEPHRPEPHRPEPARAAAPVGSPGPLGSPGPVGSPPPRPGPVPGEESSYARRPVSSSPGSVSDGVYRSRRPAVAALVGVPAAVLEIPVLIMLVGAAFGDPIVVPGVVSAACLVLALPLLAVGLYAVATGAVRAAGPNSAQAWLRPPVAYLTVGLVLFIAAGLAA